MIVAFHPFWRQPHKIFDLFNEVHLFGSALEKEYPHDIDIVLIYGNNSSADIKQVCDVFRDCVFQQFGIEAHLMVLSTFEESEIQFLKQVKSVQIK